MTTLSGCTVVRNAVKLKYPLEASILTYYPLCDEVVISYDPTTDDGTDDYIKDLARRYPKIRPVPSPWNMSNHEGGTEITIQSNVAAEACRSDWILYVQADEAIHEGDHDLIREAIEDKSLNGVLFARRSFLGTLDREIPEYYARNLLRLYRNGQGSVVGDGMTCGFHQGIVPSLLREQPRMFNYSRMGDRDEVVLRSKCRDNFHISTEAAIEANVANEYTQAVGPFETDEHPGPIREFYLKNSASWKPAEAPRKPTPTVSRPNASSPVTLSLLMGQGERENLIPFFWQFRNWPGDIVVLDDMTSDGGGEVLERILLEILGLRKSAYQIIRAPLAGNFAAARNLLQDAARAPWVLTTAPDERWDANLLAGLPELVRQLDRDRKLICGFPRANFVDGILVNDVPDSEWTEEGLMAALPGVVWPPRNPDLQYRLIRKDERWVGKIHEQPERFSSHAGQVVALRDFWIMHSKTIARQRKQDAFYKSLGQQRGMPGARGSRKPAMNLREATLKEVVDRLPKGKIVAVETGTLRDSRPEARIGDGWSTFSIAQCLAESGGPGSHLYSIDIDPKCIATSKATVDKELHPWVTWICGDAVEAIRTLQEPTIDLLYLDSSDDPRQILAEFEVAQPKLAPHTIVVVDDTGPYHAGPDGKGTLVLPEAARRGWHVERRDNERCHMSVLTRSAAAGRTAAPETAASGAGKGWSWFK
jgi:hypothetical protein